MGPLVLLKCLLRRLVLALGLMTTARENHLAGAVLRQEKREEEAIDVEG